MPNHSSFQTISKFFNDQTINIREISNICLIIQASTAKLTEEQVYVFSAVLDIFGNDVVENIRYCYNCYCAGFGKSSILRFRNLACSIPLVHATLESNALF